MKTHHGLLLLAASMCACMANAGPLTPDQALQRAFPGLDRKLKNARATPRPILEMTYKDGDTPTLYVFSFDKGGYMVAPASDNVSATVLGFSDSGIFDRDSIPPAMLWWLSQYSDEVSHMESIAASASGSDTPGVGPVGLPEVEPLLSTRWNQNDPYNLYTPEYNGEHCPTGCVATAMAQVMKKWNYPRRGTGQHTYYGGYYAGGDLSADFGATTFDWDAMTDSYTETSAADAKQAVASLMYCCGVGVNMSYAPNSSGSNYEYASTALVNFFNYDKGLRDLNRNYFGIDAWTQMIYDELAAGRPVLYGGRNDNGGHAFVCDGYRSDGYFHFNWGWGGYSDGYFLVTALNPTEQGIGGSVGGYNTSQTVIVGIQPARAGSVYRPVVEFMSDFDVMHTSYDRGEDGAVEFSDRRGMYNESLGEMELVLGVRLESPDGTVRYLSSGETQTLAKGARVKGFTIPVSVFPQNGTYTVTPAVRTSDSEEWFDAFVLLDNVRDYTLTATPDELTFVPGGQASLSQSGLELRTPLYPGRECAITATLSNNSDDEYYGQVTPVLVSGAQSMMQSDAIEVNLKAGQESGYEWVCAFGSNVVPGQYTLYLLDTKGHKLGGGVKVYVKEAPAEAADPFVAGVTICGNNATANTPSAPVMADYSNFTVSMTVGNHAGYYTEVVNGAIWYDESRGVVGLGGGFVGIDAGHTSDITVSHDLTQYSLEPEHTYLLYVKGEQRGALGAPVYFRADPAAGIEIVDSPDRFSVYTDGDMLHVACPESIIEVSICSMSGAKVIETQSTDIGVSHLSQGVYIITARTVSGTLHHTKFLRR